MCSEYAFSIKQQYKPMRKNIISSLISEKTEVQKVGWVLQAKPEPALQASLTPLAMYSPQE